MPILLLIVSLLMSSFSAASINPTPIKKTFCIFDPLGASGPAFSIARDYREFAILEGIDFHLRAYTDEKIASDDFKAGQCDMVLLTGARARPFNNFGATIEAIGAVPTTKMMKELVTLISSPKAAKYMVDEQGRYEIAGVLPGGPVYLFVRDRTVDTVEELSGKRIATLDYDKASIKMVNHIGASMVPANSANFAGKFNNGSVDMAYAPAIAFKPLEMYKGIGDSGGVVRFNLAYLDFQIVMHKDKFPEGFGQKSRLEFLTFFDRAADLIEQDTKGINEEYWIDIPEEDMTRYNNMFRDVRLMLRDDGVYHPVMLSLMRKLRCSTNASAAECVEKLE